MAEKFPYVPGKLFTFRRRTASRQTGDIQQVEARWNGKQRAYRDAPRLADIPSPLKKAQICEFFSWEPDREWKQGINSQTTLPFDSASAFVLSAVCFPVVASRGDVISLAVSGISGSIVCGDFPRDVAPWQCANRAKHYFITSVQP